MRYKVYFLLLFVLFITSCKKHSIMTYRVPKEVIHVARLEDPKEIYWDIPIHWKPDSTSAFNNKRFTVSDERDDTITAVFSITSFPGDAGGILANINRWRLQLNLTEITESELESSVKTLTHFHEPISVVELTSKKPLDQDSQLTSIFSAILPHQSETYFFKLMGPSDLLDKEKDFFYSVINSIHHDHD